MDWLKETTISDALTQSTAAVGTFVLNEPELVFFEATCAILLIIVMLLMRRKNRPPQGEQDEMKRRAQLESIYADKVHDFMLDMLGKGEITRKEYKRDCRRFGVAFRLLDLLRSPKSKIGIKHKVLRNVADNHKTLPFIQPGPGPKPGEGVPASPVKPKRKVWVVVGKRRSAA
jgi:hypothetical protein